MVIIKNSYGIICFNKKDEVLVVRKNYTYGFHEFLCREFHTSDKKYIYWMFNNMHIEEKNTILQRDFDKIWLRLHHKIPNTNEINMYKYYNYKKSKINKFLQKYATDLKTLCKNSNAQYIWEFPKGRKEINETDLDVARREFYEETGISQLSYSILDNIPLMYTTNSADIRYSCKYYIAKIKEGYKNRFKRNIEIHSTQWVPLKKLKEINRNNSEAYRKSVHFERILKENISFIRNL